MKKLKSYKSENYNFIFNSINGFFVRWGKTMEDDPEYAPSPEILDIEISTICSNGCKFCYKTNTDKGKNMSLNTFKQIFKTFPKQLTQIAFGIGNIDANKDLWNIMQHCRNNDVVPNITINGKRMTNEYYDKLIKYCGAVAVSLYDKDDCYDAINLLIAKGMKQVNIHALLSNETFDKCMEVMIDCKTQKRLIGLNAIVFLWLKPKGNRNNLTQITKDKYETLVKYAIDNNISIGFDSCSAANFLKVIKKYYPDKVKAIEPNVEPCESTLFSYYINVDCVGFPCSFSEETEYKGINLLKIKNFDEVWNHPETLKFRNKLIKNKDDNGCRVCQLYNLRCKI